MLAFNCFVHDHFQLKVILLALNVFKKLYKVPSRSTRSDYREIKRAKTRSSGVEVGFGADSKLTWIIIFRHGPIVTAWPKHMNDSHNHQWCNIDTLIDQSLSSMKTICITSMHSIKEVCNLWSKKRDINYWCNVITKTTSLN
mgnify:CR=1 FL=1